MTENKQAEYWEKRFNALDDKTLEINAEYLDRLDKIRKETLDDIDHTIDRFYRQFADVENISMQEARRLLNSEELEAFHMTVEKFIELAIENEEYPNKEITKALDEASLKYRLTRIEAVKYELMAEVNYLMTKQFDTVNRCLAECYIDRYYRSVFELFKGYGIGTTFSQVDEKMFAKLAGKPWAVDGKTFSTRIWEDQKKLTNTLSVEMSRACQTGESYMDTAKRIADIMNTSRSNAYRLVETESVYFATEGQMEMYKEFDIDQYRVSVTLDERTCDECGSHDGEIYNVRDKTIGVNAPPWHPRCRCMTHPYLNDEELPSYIHRKRTARNLETGKTELVPADTRWENWIKQYRE